LATEYLDVEDALDAYAEAVEVSVALASDALLDRGRLESARARPQHAAVYEDADTIRQAATLFWGVAATQAFRDGNKRTAVVLLRTFLNINGYDFEMSEDDLYDLAMGVADSTLTVDAVETRLRPHTHPV